MDYIQRLLTFLDASPVNFLAVDTLKKQLSEAGFKELDARMPMPAVKAGDTFFLTKNDSSLYAFRMGRRPLAEAGFHVICAHCDSPTFRIKPNAEMLSEGILRLNTEVYGGPILSTWFDRPLSLAGRVILRTADPMQPETRLLHIRRPLLQISNLAIHFNRQVNDGVKLSKQKDMLPIMGIEGEGFGSKDEGLGIGDKGLGSKDEGVLLQLICEELNREIVNGKLSNGKLSNAQLSNGKLASSSDLLDFDLYLYDTTPACTFGLHQEFLSAGRLDDLSMVHAGLEALLAADKAPETTQVLAIFDNEETGSQTKQGAGSPFFASLLQRIVAVQNGSMVNGSMVNGIMVNGEMVNGSMVNPTDAYYRAVERAFMVSADNAHAFHPNYAEKYDPTNHPRLGGGPVIKFNAAQKYASDAQSAAVFASVCERAGVPCQRFVNHSDVAGGSTLGNILAGSLPLRGVDMGAPVLAMHSCRETASCADHLHTIRAFTEFYNL